MDKFKKKLSTTNILLFVLIVITVTATIITTYSNIKSESPDFNHDFHFGFSLGFGITLALILTGFIIRNIYVMSDPERLKKHYYKKNDERTKMIMQKSGAIGFPIVIIGLAVAINISLFFYNETVSYTLIITMFCICAVMFALRLFYKIKLG